MRHLHELHIHQFRGLRGLKLHDLGQVNLFIGGNNSGKTSVLEAVATFARPLDPHEWLNTARRRELMLSSVPVIDSLEWFFPHDVAGEPGNFLSGETHISGQGIFPVREVRAFFNEVHGTPPATREDAFTDTVRRGAELTLTARVMPEADGASTTDTVSKTFLLWEDEPLIQRQPTVCPMLPVNTITPHAHRVERIQIQQLSETAFLDVKTTAVALLQRFDPDVQDLEVWSRNGQRPNLYIKHKRSGLAPLSSFGDGMRRALLIATIIPLCRDGILLIDELETAIHTQLLPHVFRWLVQACVENNIQLFTTTHSLEAVDTILEVSDTADLVSYRLQQRDVATTAKRFDKELLTRLREDLGREVRW